VPHDDINNKKYELVSLDKPIIKVFFITTYNDNNTT